MTPNRPSKADRQRSARAKIEAQRLARARRRRRRRLASAAGGALLIATAAVALWQTTRTSHVLADVVHAAGPSIDRNPALLASTAHQADGKPVDKVVKSNGMERTDYHIHSHLSVFVNGSRKTIPYGVGIVPPYSLQTAADGSRFVSGGSAFYFLHTHDETGIIHVESPNRTQYTLGNFFDVWGQPLTTGQVGPYKGKVTVYVDGRPYAGAPGSIVFKDHETIQLDIGTDTAFRSFVWPQGY